jgi:hypothetical protein
MICLSQTEFIFPLRIKTDTYAQYATIHGTELWRGWCSV